MLPITIAEPLLSLLESKSFQLPLRQDATCLVGFSQPGLSAVFPRH